MMGSLDEGTQARTLSLFADIFDYPCEQLPSIASECAGLVAGWSGQAAKEVGEFGTFVQSVGHERMEEIYTRTFDVTPTTTLYVGYHLFGDSYKRGGFLVTLQQEYRKHGFSAGAELADHLSPVLRFASLTRDPGFVDPLLFEAVLPALQKVDEAFQGSDNTYRLAVSALKGYLARAGAEYLESLEKDADASGESPGVGLEATNASAGTRAGVQG